MHREQVAFNTHRKLPTVCPRLVNPVEPAHVPHVPRCAAHAGLHALIQPDRFDYVLAHRFTGNHTNGGGMAHAPLFRFSLMKGAYAAPAGFGGKGSTISLLPFTIFPQ